jgi:hypothetical protein
MANEVIEINLLVHLLYDTAARMQDIAALRVE